jgi:hypothetical protein
LRMMWFLFDPRNTINDRVSTIQTYIPHKNSWTQVLVVKKDGQICNAGGKYHVPKAYTGPIIVPLNIGNHPQPHKYNTTPPTMVRATPCNDNDSTSVICFVWYNVGWRGRATTHPKGSANSFDVVFMCKHLGVSDHCEPVDH